MSDTKPDAKPDAKPEIVLYPTHCRVAVAQDKSSLAFTFTAEQREPVTIVLPLAGAVGLQRKLAQSLYLLGVRPLPAKSAAAAQPAPDAQPAPVGQPAPVAQSAPDAA